MFLILEMLQAAETQGTDSFRAEKTVITKLGSKMNKASRGREQGETEMLHL